MAIRTPSQTIGPFFHVGLKWEGGEKVAFESPGERIILTGYVRDGAGNPIADAMIETWQSGPDGTAPLPGSAARVTGYSRAATDADGRYTIETMMPGACTAAGGQKLPSQIHVTIFARGLLKALRTRVFLAELAAVKGDPLASAAGPRVGTLIAIRDAKVSGTWRWDVRFQGKDETVFIEI